MGLRPGALRGAGGFLRHRPRWPGAGLGAPAHGHGAPRQRPAGHRGRGLQPRLRRRPRGPSLHLGQATGMQMASLTRMGRNGLGDAGVIVHPAGAKGGGKVLRNAFPKQGACPATT